MPVIIKSQEIHPFLPSLGSPLAIEQIRAEQQDIRPLEIAIINLMADKISTERQLALWLGNTMLQVHLSFVATDSYVEGVAAGPKDPQHAGRAHPQILQRLQRRQEQEVRRPRRHRRQCAQRPRRAGGLLARGRRRPAMVDDERVLVTLPLLGREGGAEILPRRRQPQGGAEAVRPVRASSRVRQDGSPVRLPRLVPGSRLALEEPEARGYPQGSGARDRRRFGRGRPEHAGRVGAAQRRSRAVPAPRLHSESPGIRDRDAWRGISSRQCRWTRPTRCRVIIFRVTTPRAPRPICGGTPPTSIRTGSRLFTNLHRTISKTSRTRAGEAISSKKDSGQRVRRLERRIGALSTRSFSVVVPQRKGVLKDPVSRAAPKRPYNGPRSVPVYCEAGQAKSSARPG